jgi:acyl carrier protein
MTHGSQVKDTVRSFILAEYLIGESPSNLSDDTPLRTSGILDSMATLALVSFLEERFGIRIEAHETGVDTFDRLDDIVALVERKQSAGV